MASVRQQTRVAGARERRTALLYAHEPRARGARAALQSMARVAVRHVARGVSNASATVLFPRRGR